ncbi:MAG: hypothetical protein IPL51_10105 [Candidatus Competibacteraceae bacterium]|nr:hypothetical protein [Candidatus Competibacteraceae bacterium]
MTEPYAIEIAADAWNGNAVSVATLRFDGEYSFRVGQCAGIAVGLSPYPSLGDPTRCTHGFLFEGARVSITESGIVRSLSSPYWSSDDIFSIRRVGGAVTYRQNGALLYASSRPSFGEVMLDAALYADGDEVLDLVFAPMLADERGAGPFPAPIGRGQDADAVGQARILPLFATAVPVTVDTASAQFPPIAACGGDASDRGRSTLPALVGSGGSIAAPRYDRGRGVFSPVSASGTEAEPGTGAGDEALPALVGTGADVPDFGLSRFPPLAAIARSAVLADALFYGFLPGLTGWGPWNRTRLAIPPPGLYARARHGASGAAWLRVPALRLTASGGALARVSPPPPILTAAAAMLPVARAAIAVPAPLLRASGTGTVSGRSALAMPAPRARAIGGGQVRLTVPRLALRAISVLKPIARLAVSLPPLLLRAAAAPDPAGAILVAHVPAPHLRAGILLASRLHVPPPVLRASGDAAAPNVTTWAMNAETGAITEWIVGDVVRWAVVGETLYGLLADGTLFVLGGESDNGTPVEWSIQFAPSHFGTNSLKRMDKVYFNMRGQNGAVLEVMEDETEAWRYPVEPARAPATGTHRCLVGRGLRFHTAGLALRGNGPMAVGGIEVLTVATSRRPK